MKDYHGAQAASTPTFDDRIIEAHYRGLGPTARACLAVCDAMSLRGRARPLALILEGPSGSGKTAVVQMFMPKAEPTLNDHVYRSDKFTPKSFVSHAANVKARDMEKLDMLPRLRDKILLTKELAPIFRGRDEEVSDNFSMLISGLDGEGFIGDSGMRGRRGYADRILFNWIGASTPLSPKTHRMMAQLGTRIFFYEVPALKLSEHDLVEYAVNGNPTGAATECNAAVNRFLLAFFEKHPVGSIDPTTIEFPKHLLEQLVRLATLLVAGRAEIKYEKDCSEWEPISAAQPEGAWKVIDHFKELALGHALIDGRRTINNADLELIAQVAISSLPGQIRPVIRRLCDADLVTSTECQGLCGVSRPTARTRLRELELLWILIRTKGGPTANSADTGRLAHEFGWLRQP